MAAIPEALIFLLGVEGLAYAFLGSLAIAFWLWRGMPQLVMWVINETAKKYFKRGKEGKPAEGFMGMIQAYLSTPQGAEMAGNFLSNMGGGGSTSTGSPSLSRRVLRR